ncbi:hypothetical protein OTU49_008343 [Cherax quadricarinatus]|uniref:Uncharacterized protein n=1 Tax=Cherax quadricarinatus TaxID=27406 RepID=A0AAW0WRB7_CHEQU|nr:uncharacterized protein LOC128704130 [Cherax quadricarinatus]XP_053655159.1 uncharacterized protein LOC128704130 [Cherax quadricarinatus]
MVRAEVSVWRRGAWTCVAASLLLLTYTNTFKPLLHTPPRETHNLSFLESHLPWWDGGHCRCDGQVCVAEATTEVSIKGAGGTCGRRSWAAGDKQRVVSLSLYGDNPDYWLGLKEILHQVGVMYPGWMVRLYTVPHAHATHLCPLLNLYTNFYVCDITNLPPPLGNISHVHPMMWRIAPLGDPQVTALMVRDSDSQVSERERAAVKAWLESGKHFHVMRDHPSHDVHILGGMWGARWDQRLQYQRENALLLSSIRNEMLEDAQGMTKYGEDQQILTKRLWPLMVGRVLAHDSYCCLLFRGTTPWPTQRIDGYFVGSPSFRKEYKNQTVPKPCPVRCRPKQHRDWIYC